MSHHNKDGHSHDSASHSHGAGTRLPAEAAAILQRGLRELLHMTEGLEFRPLPSEKFPLPLASAVYGAVPSPQTIRDDVEARLQTDPVSVLESALVLVELYESNQPDIAPHILGDMPFLGTCFNSKRCNGWIAAIGGGDGGSQGDQGTQSDRAELESAVNAKWQFKFFSGLPRPTGLYVLLSMLARYAFVYGRIAPGDMHDLGHFVEDYCPGLIVCRGPLTDLELTLSLAAMKMGVPAVVPGDYPFPLGRSLRAESLEEVAEAVVGFANVRRLIRTPEIPQLPPYCDEENAKQEIVPDVTWGGTPESFVLVRKGPVPAPGAGVVGRPAMWHGHPGHESQGRLAPGFFCSSTPPSSSANASEKEEEAHGRDARATHGQDAHATSIGVLVTIDAEPMDAFDCDYIEQSIVPKLRTMRGVGVRYSPDAFAVLLAKGADLAPARIGEVLLAAVAMLFPKLKDRARVEVIFDAPTLAKAAPEALSAKLARRREIEEATEEGAAWFIGCTGCSPFAPDHVCIVTPQRPPQCGRPLGLLKTGALYSYDDMTNIHHSRLQRDVNSFAVIDKGECLDPARGEWSGVNAHAAAMTRGRTRRIRLHSLEDFPHTGCGCFGLILFRTDKPRPGIGIMERGYAGACPDGRTWKDLHYQLAGKQAPGVTGAAAGYLRSPKFLQGDGGWSAVVWVGPKVAAMMDESLPAGVEVGKP